MFFKVDFKRLVDTSGVIEADSLEEAEAIFEEIIKDDGLEGVVIDDWYAMSDEEVWNKYLGNAEVMAEFGVSAQPGMDPKKPN